MNGGSICSRIANAQFLKSLGFFARCLQKKKNTNEQTHSFFEAFRALVSNVHHFKFVIRKTDHCFNEEIQGQRSLFSF